MLFELVTGYGYPALDKANTMYIVIMVAIAVLLAMILVLCLDAINKLKSSSIAIIVFAYALYVCYALAFSVVPLVEVDEIKDTRVELDIKDYEIAHGDSDYILLNKNDGAMYRSSVSNYIKFKGCNKPKLYAYDYTLKYSNGLYKIGATNTQHTILCEGK